MSILKELSTRNFRHLTGTLETGMVFINEADGSEFVWVPVTLLEADGLLNFSLPNQKLGIRNWHSQFQALKSHKETVPDHVVQSIANYGGFLVSRTPASEEDGKIVFKKGLMPLQSCSYSFAYSQAEKYCTEMEHMESALMYGATYDCILKWIVQTGDKTLREVTADSCSWGNYGNSPNTPNKYMPTGSNEKWSACNIYDLAGNCWEWTQEEKLAQDNTLQHVLRGGNHRVLGHYWTPADRYFSHFDYPLNLTSFRAILFLV